MELEGNRWKNEEGVVLYEKKMYLCNVFHLRVMGKLEIILSNTIN